MDSLPHPSHGGATAYGPDVQGADASSSNHAFREAVERSPDGFTLLTAVRDASGRIADFRRQYVNPAAAVLLGRPREVLVDGLLLETTPWDAVQRDLFSRYVSIVEGGGELDLEVHVPLRDGGSRWIRLTAVKVGDGVAATFTDVTARTAAIREWRAAERALRASDERFRLATDAIHAIVYDIDYTTERAVRSRGLREVLGFDPDEVPDTNAWWFERMHVDDLARVRDEMRTATAGTAAELRFEYRLRHRDGHWVHVEDQSIAIYAGDRLVRQVGCCQDVTDLRDAVAAVRDRAEELAALMEASPGVTFIAHDPEARVITGNRAAREALRMSGKDNLSKTGPAAADAAHFSVWSQGRKLRPEELPLQVAAAGQEVRDFDDEIRFDNGETVFLFGSAVPLRDEHGRSRGAVGAFVDVTSLKRAEQALREADRRKDEFLAMLAHELRNPLAPILNAVEVLKRLGPPGTQVGAMRDTIERQVAQLARLVDDLLDVSRITQNRIALRMEPLEMMTVVGRAVETSRPLIDARRHHLAVSMTEEPVRVAGDLARLAQVVSNLLNNAAKYTDEGGHLRLDVVLDGGEVVIVVADDGVGIAADVLPHVFDLFAQADRSLDRSQGGLGIGLTLVRRLVEMHGGRVEATSAGLGCGCQFRVFLPRLVEEPASHGAEPGTEPVSSRAFRILVVDDNVDSAESLALLLDLDGHHTLQAHTGPAALDAARTFDPHLVLLDIGLPGMDGYEVARRLRALPGGASVFVVALTGYGRPEDRQRALAAGCHAHMTKPVNFAELEALIRTIPRL